MRDSPRWLISKARPTAALDVLRQIRSAEAVQRGIPELEIAALENAAEVVEFKAPWVELFNAKNRRRTG